MLAAEPSAEITKRWKSAIANDSVLKLQQMWQTSDYSRELIAVRSDNGKNALMIACKTGELEFFNALIAAGVDPESTTLTGGTPLMFAALGNRTLILQHLLDLGVDTDALGSNGWSAMTIAAAKGYTDMIRTLAGAGADINVTDIYGWTPLMRAVDNGHWSSVVVLSELDGADLDNQDEAGNTALHHAVVHRNIDMVSQLIKQGASRNIENFSGLTPRQLAIAGSGSAGPDEGLFSLFDE